MRLLSCGLILLLALAAGCQQTLYFPATTVAAPSGVDSYAAYAPRGETQPHFFYFANDQGRVDRMGYDLDRDGLPDKVVNLDEIPFDRCRHVVIILDGFSYDVVREYYDQGNLRLFHQPSRVVAPYPTLTDLCMEDMLDYIPCKGMEAQYFDREQNKVVGGALCYLKGDNEPYVKLLDYRADLIWDAISYVYPFQTFGHELNDAWKVIEKRRSQEVLTYFVSSAGVSTALGKQGQIRSLQRVERFVNQLYYETNGMVKVTIIADHGHSYTPAKRIRMEDFLESHGWKMTEKLHNPRDVVYIRFGLETYIAMHTLSPAPLAKDVATAQGVDLVSYADCGNVMVLANREGKMESARILRKGERYKYEPIAGDPLMLSPILAGLSADADGFIDAQEMFVATATHEYPAPLERLWRAHFGIVEHPADVLVSLDNCYYSGACFFANSVDLQSTHGSLNYTNSVTFIMSSAGDLPPVLRTGDIPEAMTEMTGRKFPARR